jgi:hypothetical protein
MASSGFCACACGRPCSGPGLAWTPPGGWYGLEGRVRAEGGLNPRARRSSWLWIDSQMTAFVYGKAGGGGLLRVLGCLPKSPRSTRWVEDRATDLKHGVFCHSPSSLWFWTPSEMVSRLRTNARWSGRVVTKGVEGRSALVARSYAVSAGISARNHPPNRQNSRTRWCLRKGCNPEPRFSGLWVTLVALGPSDVTKTIVFRASRDTPPFSPQPM